VSYVVFVDVRVSRGRSTGTQGSATELGYLCLLKDFFFDGSLVGFLSVLGLDTDLTTTPFSSEVDVVVVLRTEGLAQVLEVAIVLFTDFSKGDASGGLLTDQLAQSCLALDNAEGNFLLSAEGWEPHNEFDWVDVVGDSNKLGFLVFDQVGDVVQAVLEGGNLSALLLFLAGSLVLGSGEESFFLLL